MGEADRGGKDAKQAWDLSKDWQRVVSTQSHWGSYAECRVSDTSELSCP